MEKPDMLRVDVAGYSVKVRGDEARKHLERVNSELGRMRIALHRISKMHPSGPGAGTIAREALSDD